MRRVIKSTKTDERAALIHHGFEALNQMPHLDFVNFVLPSPAPTTPSACGEAAVSGVVYHATIQTEPEIIRFLSDPPLKGYRITYKDDDFYFTPATGWVFERERV